MMHNRPRWSSRTKLTVVLLLLGLGLMLLYLFRAALAPFIIALLLAYVLSAPVNWLQARLPLRRGLAILLTYLLVLIALIAIPLVLIPPLAAQSSGLNLKIQRFLSEVERLLGGHYTLAGRQIDLQTAFESTIGSFQGLIEPLFSQSLRFVVEALSSLVWVVFIIVITFYLIKDSAALLHWLEGLTPPSYREDFRRLRDEINLVWHAFLLGQITLALVVATIFSIVGLVLGLPFALAMGVLAGLLEFLPSIGHGMWMITATLLALFAGSTWLPLPNWVFALIIIGLHLFFQIPFLRPLHSLCHRPTRAGGKRVQ